MPTAEEKISELTTATKMGDVGDILALVQEIRQHGSEWFAENSAPSDVEKLDDTCRQSLNAVIEISESKVHAALSRGDVAAARENFKYIEQVCAFAPEHSETASRINEKIQQAENQPRRHLSPVRICPACGESNPLDAVLCKACGIRISRRRIPQEAGPPRPTGGVVTVRPSPPAPTGRKLPLNAPVLLGAGATVVVALAFGLYLRTGRPDQGTTGPSDQSTASTPQPTTPAAIVPARVGSAKITVKTVLRKDPGASNSIREIPSGSEVNLLDRMPETRADAWAFIGLKDNTRGYVRNRELSHVATDDSQFDQWHAALAIADLSLSADQLRSRLDWAEGVTSRAGDVSDELRVKMAKSYAALSKKASDETAQQGDCLQARRQIQDIKNKKKYEKETSSVAKECPEKVDVVAERKSDKTQPIAAGKRLPDGPEASEFMECENASKSAKSTADYVVVVGACNNILKRVFKNRSSPGYEWVRNAGNYVRQAVDKLEEALKNADKQYHEAAEATAKSEASAIAGLRQVIAICNQLGQIPESRLDEVNGRVKKVRDGAAALKDQAKRGCGSLNGNCQ